MYNIRFNSVRSMLPPALEKICSLLPNEDKLAVSIIFRLNSRGCLDDSTPLPRTRVENQVLTDPKTRIMRSKIRSCCKLDYKTTSDMADFFQHFSFDEAASPDVEVSFQASLALTSPVDNDHSRANIKSEVDDSAPSFSSPATAVLVWEEWSRPMHDSPYSCFTVARNVSDLSKLANSRRTVRFESGAVKIQQSEVQFCADGYFTRAKRYSTHELIEEFMLLANFTAAKELVTKFGDAAFLRVEPSLLPRGVIAMTDILGECADQNKMRFSADNSRRLNKAMELYNKGINDESVKLALRQMLILNLPRSRYRPINGLREYKHFLLDLEHYTHFTSPIRRYADVLVHKMLVSTLTPTATGAEQVRAWKSSASIEMLRNMGQQLTARSSYSKKFSYAVSVFIFYSYDLLNYNAFLYFLKSNVTLMM